MQRFEPQQSSKGEKEGSDVDSDYDSSLENSKSFSGDDGFRIEPIVSNHIDPHEPNIPANANLNSTDTVLVPAKSSTKRPREASEARTKKNKIPDDGRERKSVVALPSDEPMKAISRLWDEDDEIVILKGMIDYAKNGGEPYVDAVGFLDSIKKSLHFDPNVQQLRNKIRKLKIKYTNIAKRAKPDEDPVFAKPHELKSYELWKQIWGREDGQSGAVAISTMKKKKKKKSVATEQKGVDLSRKSSLKESEGSNWSLHPCLNDLMRLDMDSTGESVVTEQTGLIERRNLLISEIETYLKWIELVKGQAMQVLKALESSDSMGLF